MDRRQLLARFGAVLGTASLGGCLSRYRDVTGEVGDSTTTETTEEDTTTGEDTTTEGGTTTEEDTTTEESTDANQPTLVDRQFAVTESGCGEPANEASVEFDSASTVSVTGTISGSNACYTAKLADASYDPEAGSLDVTVASVQKEGAQACAQCIVEIGYEATFDFEGGLPETVTVVHEAMDGTTTVATAESS